MTTGRVCEICKTVDGPGDSETCYVCQPDVPIARAAKDLCRLALLEPDQQLGAREALRIVLDMLQAGSCAEQAISYYLKDTHGFHRV